jgi:hypothetical protein
MVARPDSERCSLSRCYSHRSRPASQCQAVGLTELHVRTAAAFSAIIHYVWAKRVRRGKPARPLRGSTGTSRTCEGDTLPTSRTGMGTDGSSLG